MVDSALRYSQRLYLAPKHQNSDRIQQIRLADQERREQFYIALDDYAKVVMMTGNPEKAIHLVRFLKKVFKLDETDVATQTPHLPELASRKVHHVAESKAAQIFSSGAEYVDMTHPATQALAERLSSLVHLNHFINTAGLNLIRQALPTGTIALAADVNSFQQDGETKEWTQTHRLDRKGEMDGREKLKLIAEMKQFYCFPSSGEIRVMWDNALAMLNGQSFHFHDRIEVISEPIDPLVFDIFINEALENGLFYTSNTHFGLLECLIANQKIKTIAVLSDEEIMRGLMIQDKRMQPVQSDFPVLLAAIKGNRPPRLIW